MIHFNRVTKIYDNQIPAVADIEFKIDEGEFVFLIGPSGSGKTTVIKMLIRDEVPTTGKVFFRDRDITRINRKRVYKLRREIGVIFQDFKLIPEKTAFENVSFAMEVAGKQNREIKDTVPYVLDIVGLSHRQKAFPKQLSGGEQQRVAIARAIANNPKILIADEPTGNLDPASAWDIIQVLTKINNWGTTVIMSTHGTDIVNSLNKRVIQMDGGRVIRDDNKGKYEMVQNFESNLLKESSQEDDKEELEDKSEKRKRFTFNIRDKDRSLEMSKPKLGFFGKIKSIFKRNKKTDMGIKEVIEAFDQIQIESPKKLHEYLNINNPSVEDTSDSKAISTDLEPDKATEEIVKTKKTSKSKKQKAKKTKNVKIDTKEIVQEVEPEIKEELDEYIEQSRESGEITTKDLKSNLEKNKNINISKLNLSKSIVKKLRKKDIMTLGELVEFGIDGLADAVDLDTEELLEVAREINNYLI